MKYLAKQDENAEKEEEEVTVDDRGGFFIAKFMSRVTKF